ncbi:MAG: DUF1501 domain-containing protein, partial [Bacteroidota bacterium]
MLNRRKFLRDTSFGLGAVALSSLLSTTAPPRVAKAKRVIYLFMSGAPSQLETFDYKPALHKWHGKEIPPSVRGTQRNSGMVTDQSSFPLVQPSCGFKQYGRAGAWVSEYFPHTAKIVDDLCFVNSMYTEAINHTPAVSMMQTGSQQPGRPGIGAWLSYGLGSVNQELPAFVVLNSLGRGGQPLSPTAWSNGFLPSQHQGVQLRSGIDPVLYLNDPEGISRTDRREQLDVIQGLNASQHDRWEDPEIQARIAQYEMAFKMQASVPEALDLSDEPEHIYQLYGEEARKPGTFAFNCLRARRLAERDVRFIQLYHTGWDHHGGLPGGMRRQARETDQASAALVADLKQRGLLEDTLVIWGGEFGRTSFSQGRLTKEGFGRDHHPGCFSMWFAGAGVKAGSVYGRTDELGYNVVENGVHVHDFQATLLHLLGIDHEA